MLEEVSKQYEKMREGQPLFFPVCVCESVCVCVCVWSIHVSVVTLLMTLVSLMRLYFKT